MTAPVILVEASVRDAGDGSARLVRLAGGGGVHPYHYGGEHWRAGLAGMPRSIAKLDFDGEQLGGGGVPQALELTWAPSTNRDLAELSALYWQDAPVTVRIGPEGDALPPIDTAGLVLDASVSRGALVIALADLATDLKRPLLVARYAGTGGVEGPPEWEGQIKPRAWGRCFNVLGRLIDPGAGVWCFGDPMRGWDAFVQVRDKGVPAAAMVLLGWQGSAAATLAALRVAVAPPGGCVVCPSIACAKWWTTPAGDLRADIRGENAGGYVETAPAIAARLIAARSALAIAPGELDAARAARPAPFGWRCDSESVTAASAVSEVLGDVSLSWVIAAGGVAFRRWEWSAPVRVARSEGVSRERLVKPVTTRKLGYRRNQAPMARGDLAGIVLAGEVVYPDGQTADDLQPAEPGATRGALPEQLQAIAEARTVADAAQTLADGKIETFYQAEPPATGSAGDLWFDTDDGNKLFRHDGTGWAVAADAAIGTAITAAAGAQASADGKVTTFYVNEPPQAEAVGDLWYSTATGELTRWDGAQWRVVSTVGAPPGTPVGDRDAQAVIDGLDDVTLALLEKVLRLEELAVVVAATSYVEGQPVGPVFLSFKNAQEGLNEGTASTLALIGYRTADGTAFVMNLDTVHVDGSGKSLAQRLDEVGLDNGDLAIKVSQLMEAVIDDDGTGLGRFVLRADVNGNVVGITGTAGEEASELAFVAEQFRFVRPGGGDPVQLLTYQNGRWTFSADVYATRLVADVIEAKNIKAGEITDMDDFEGVFPDAFVNFASGEVEIAKIENVVIGDAVDGKALVSVNLMQDGSSQADSGLRIRVYVNTGAGEVLRRDVLQGIRVSGSGADARWSLPAAFSLVVKGQQIVSLRVTATAQQVSSGGGTPPPSYARGISMTILKGFR